MAYSIGHTLTSLEEKTTNHYRVQRQHNGDASIMFDVKNSTSVPVSGMFDWEIKWDYLSGSSQNSTNTGTPINYDITYITDTTITYDIPPFSGPTITYNIPRITMPTTMLVTAKGTIATEPSNTNIQLSLIVTILPPASLCNVEINTSNRSLKSTELKPKKARIVKRDLYIGDQLVTPYVEGQIVLIEGLLDCNDSKFSMKLTDFDVDPVNPISIEVNINNRSSGLTYRYTFTPTPTPTNPPIPPTTIPPYTFTLPGMFGAGDYLIQLTELNGICLPSQIYEFIILAPNIVDVIADFPHVLCNDDTTTGYISVIFDQTFGPCYDGFTLYVKIVKYPDLVIDPLTGNVITTTGSNSGWYPLVNGSDTFSNVVLGAGSYIATVIQVCNSNCESNNNLDNICGASTNFTICQPDKLKILLCDSVIRLKCNGDTSGMVTAWACGGAPPYTYGLLELSDDTTSTPAPIEYKDSPSFTGLGAGHYELYAQDDNKCTTFCEFEVTEPDVITVTIELKRDKCGRITRLVAHAVGGTPFGCCDNTSRCGCISTDNVTAIVRSESVPHSYLYKWYTNNDRKVVICTDSIMDYANNCVTGGVYIVDVFDSNCCVGTCSVTIPNQPPVALPPALTVCKHWIDECTYSIALNIDGGVEPFIYYINDKLLDDDITCFVFNKTHHFVLKVVGGDGKCSTITF